MLRSTAESLFLSPAQTLVNTVNTVGVMGKGIALEFKKRYPRMFERYRMFCDDGSLTVGKLQLYKTPNKWILNFPTKEHWRGPSKLEWIESGLRRFAETYRERGIISASFPMLGCGNGGLPWDEVGPLMKRYLDPLPIPVFIHMRRNAPGFVPEHEDPEEKRTFSEPRMQIGFEQFLEDLLRLTGRDPSPYDGSESEPAPLPSIQIADKEFPGEALENLWYRLTQRGALSVNEMPGTLAHLASDVADCLLKLDYIRKMTFLSGDSDSPSVVQGLRLSPPPRRSVGPLFDDGVTVAKASLS